MFYSSPPFPIYSSPLVLLPTSLRLPPPPPPSLPSVSSFPASRIRRGGPGRRPAALLREGVLVVSSHVEPHAAPPIPQPVGAGRADVAEQEVCHGMLRTGQMSDRSVTKLKANKPRYDAESSRKRSARCHPRSRMLHQPP